MNTASFSSYTLKPRQSLADDLAVILSKQIDSGEYAPGDSLPSEQALAASFAVSRTVVREALIRLRQKGTINSQRGRAPTVTDPRDREPGQAFEFEEITVENYLAFNNFRLMIEGESAAQAAINASEAQIEKLFSLVAAMEKDIAAGKSGVERDFQFHRLLGAANGNEYLRDLVRAVAVRIWRDVYQSRTRWAKPTAAVREVCVEHLAVAEAIAAREPHKARIAARTHLLNSAERQGFSSDRSLLLFA